MRVIAEASSWALMEGGCGVGEGECAKNLCFWKIRR